jgi:hypothetical protein
MTGTVENQIVPTDMRLAHFIRRLAPAADPEQVSALAGAPARTRLGHAVSLLRYQTAEMSQLHRAVRRGLPVIAIMDQDMSPSPLAAMPSGWLASGALAAPTIAVSLDAIEAASQAKMPGSGADLVARLSSGADRANASHADLTALDPAGLADAIDAAITALSGPGTANGPGELSAELSTLVPTQPGAAYAMEPILRELLDGGGYVETAHGTAAELVTGFGAVRGLPLAVLASRPDHDHGQLTFAGIRRIGRFLKLVDRLGIPLLSVVDSAGVAWELCPDTLESLRDSLLAMYNLGAPKFVLLAGDAFGLAAHLMGIGMRADFVSAWPRGRIAADHDVDADDSNVLAAARAGLVHDVLHPDETYQWLADLMSITTGAPAQEASRG